MEDTFFGSEVGVWYVDCNTHEEPGAPLRFETDVASSLAQLEERRCRRQCRDEFCSAAAGFKEPSLRGGQCQLLGTRALPEQIQVGDVRLPAVGDDGTVGIAQCVQIEHGAAAAAATELFCEFFGLCEHFTHSQIQRVLAEIERILQGTIDPRIEPAVHSPFQEVERKTVEDQQRQHRQGDEHHDHSQSQSCARLTTSQLTDELAYVDEQQDHEPQQP